MKKIILLAFLISIIVVGILYVLNSKKFNLYDGKYLKPYLFSFGVDEDRYKNIIDKKYIDPLGVSVTAVSYFYYGNIQKEIASKIFCKFLINFI